MALITSQLSDKNTYHNDLFSIHTQIGLRDTSITMQLFTPFFTTRSVPHASSFLERYLPSIMKSKCFNDKNYSFRKEVKTTELGHLFEHILLEKISELKFKIGASDPIHNGLTHWNWQKDKMGVFHISVDIGTKDERVFLLALSESVALFVEMLRFSPINIVILEQPDYLAPLKIETNTESII